MSYTPFYGAPGVGTGWEDGLAGGTPVDAAALDTMEQGIVNASTAIDALPTTYQALASGGDPFAAVPTHRSDGSSRWLQQGAANVDAFLAAGDGATDDGPAFQAAFDASRTVDCTPGKTYFINSGVFLDAPVNNAKYLLRLNGATITLGSGLPKASSFAADAATGWAFWAGQQRSALSAGTVNVQTSTRSSSFGHLDFLTIEGGIIDGQNNNVGISYGNNCPMTHQRLTVKNQKYGMSWNGYSDGSRVDVHLTGQASGGWYIMQEALGDGIRCHIKGNGCGHWYAVGCKGGIVQANVGGAFFFKTCWDIVIEVSHFGQDDNAGATASPFTLTMDRSQVTVRSSHIGAGKGIGNYNIIINDTTDTWLGSLLNVEDCVPVYYFRTSDAADPGRDPFIHITAANSNTRVRCVAVRARLWLQWSSDSALRYPEGVWIDSDVSAIQTAITAGMDQIASGSFDLFAAGAASWKVAPLFGGTAAGIGWALPSTVAATVDTAGVLGALDTVGSTYTYAFNAKKVALATLLTGPSPTATSATTPSSNGTIGVSFSNASVYACVIALWRKTNAGSYDHYIEIPCDGAKTKWFDTGTHINGRAWQTTGIPAVP